MKAKKEAREAKRQGEADKARLQRKQLKGPLQLERGALTGKLSV